MNNSNLSRREALKVALLAAMAVPLAACARLFGIEPTATTASSTTATSGQSGFATDLPPTVLEATPACGDDDDPTPAQTEGPFYTPETPERTSLLEADIEGTLLVLTGQVLSTDCQPIAGALLDFWHCGSGGVYDNAGYKLRGHQFADAQGNYRLETIQPGLYTGRTRHIHVKAQAPNQPMLTTQLYFPNEPDNATDGIFDMRLLMDVSQSGEGLQASFNFVLEVS